MRVIVLLAVLASGCAATRPPASPEPAPESPGPQAQPAPVRDPAASRAELLYSLDEALKDALSGPWEHLGTGPWHGNYRVHACAYRNARVIVVNVYCATKEPKAFRLDVYSPTRGWARIYAEGKAPISTLSRRDYFTFTAEAQPPPPPAAGLPPVALAMSFADLQRYDERRYQQFLPGCYGGVEIHRARGGCLGDLAPRAATWAERNTSFFEQPPDDWYRIVRELRALAGLHGKSD